MIIQLLVPLGAVVEDVVVVHEQLLAGGDGLGGGGAGDVAVHGVAQVGELAVAAEAVVHLVRQRGHVRGGGLELDRDVHVSPS